MEGMDHRARGRKRAGPLANAIVESEITIRQRHSRIRRLFTVANGVHTIHILLPHEDNVSSQTRHFRLCRSFDH